MMSRSRLAVQICNLAQNDSKVENQVSKANRKTDSKMLQKSIKIDEKTIPKTTYFLRAFFLNFGQVLDSGFWFWFFGYYVANFRSLEVPIFYWFWNVLGGLGESFAKIWGRFGQGSGRVCGRFGRVWGEFGESWGGAIGQNEGRPAYCAQRPAEFFHSLKY